MSRKNTKVIAFPVIGYWGGCPQCGKNDGCLSVGAVHWYVCHKHRTKWCVGENLFSGWREQTDQERRRNAAMLSTYRIVKSLPGQVVVDESAFEDEECPF